MPEGWAWARLRNICFMTAGKSKSKEDIKRETFDNCYPCYGGNGQRGYVDTYNYSGKFSIIGRQGALCGNINIAEGKFYATEHAVVVTIYGKIDFYWNTFILEALNLNQYSTGAAQPGLSVATVLSILVPLPPYEEQLKISEILTKSIEIINRLSTDKSDLQSTIQFTKSKILDLAIRGKLVPQDPNDEPASVLLERIRAEKEELIKQGKIKRNKKESVIFKGDDNSYYEKIGENVRCINEEIPFDLPSNSLFVRFKDVWGLLSGRDLAPGDYNDNEQGVPYITGASNFDNGKVEVTRWTHCPQVVTKTGDLLITCKGTVGEMAFNTFGDSHIARQIMAVRNIYNLNIKYLSLCINFYIEILKAAAKGLIPGISREDILNLILPFPSERYQLSVVSRVNELFEIIDSIKKSLS